MTSADYKRLTNSFWVHTHWDISSIIVNLHST